jgi:opacity protein-like surface antigen
MNRRIVGVVMSVVPSLVVLSFAGVEAKAQMANPANPFSFGVSGGASIPTGDFSDGTKTGFNVGAHLGMRQPLWPIGLRLDGQLNRFEDDIGLGAYLTTTGLSLNVVIAPALVSEIRPYIIGGPGFYHLSTDATAAFGSGARSSENRWGFDVGGGFEYHLTGFTTFLEARYNWVKSENSHITFVPISVGIMFR